MFNRNIPVYLITGFLESGKTTFADDTLKQPYFGIRGKTLVIATHDQSLADEVADYFVYMGEYHGYGDRPHTHINL